MRRRTFLGHGLVGFGLLAFRPPLARAASPAVPETFSAFADTLLPEDEFGPAASRLGVVTPTWRGLTAHAADEEFVLQACAWLDGQADRPFHRLPAEWRQRLVAWMADSPADQSPNMFYSRVRARLMQRYYLHAEPQRRAGLAHPPQPLGYRASLLQWRADEH